MKSQQSSRQKHDPNHLQAPPTSCAIKDSHSGKVGQHVYHRSLPVAQLQTEGTIRTCTKVKSSRWMDRATSERDPQGHKRLRDRPARLLFIVTSLTTTDELAISPTPISFPIASSTPPNQRAVSHPPKQKCLHRYNILGSNRLGLQRQQSRSRWSLLHSQATLLFAVTLRTVMEELMTSAADL